jgi:hypothetical protein
MACRVRTHICSRASTALVLRIFFSRGVDSGQEGCAVPRLGRREQTGLEMKLGVSWRVAVTGPFRWSMHHPFLHCHAPGAASLGAMRSHEVLPFRCCDYLPALRCAVLCCAVPLPFAVMAAISVFATTNPLPHLVAKPPHSLMNKSTLHPPVLQQPSFLFAIPRVRPIRPPKQRQPSAATSL